MRSTFCLICKGALLFNTLMRILPTTDGNLVNGQLTTRKSGAHGSRVLRAASVSRWTSKKRCKNFARSTYAITRLGKRSLGEGGYYCLPLQLAHPGTHLSSLSNMTTYARCGAVKQPHHVHSTGASRSQSTMNSSDCSNLMRTQ